MQETEPLIKKPFQHIYWFAAYNLDSPSTRYRGKYPLDYFSRELGISFDFFMPERSVFGLLKFLRIYLLALFFRKNRSLIVIQKVCSNGFYANSLKLLLFFRPQNTLYDLDDAEYLRQGTRSLHHFLRKCKRVSVGSESLKQYCRVFNANVFILSSPVIEHGVVKQKRNDGCLHIGWVGDLGNGNPVSQGFSYKKSMFDLFFPEILQYPYPLKLSLFGVKNEADIPEIKAFFQDSPHIELCIPAHLNWKDDLWLYDKIAQFDIGISPMVDHPFNQAKSAFKSKQYLSVGVPTLASDVGENSRFVLDQVNGLLCRGKGGFINAIHTIEKMDDAAYAEMSRQARAHRKDYSIPDFCTRLLKVMI